MEEKSSGTPNPLNPNMIKTSPTKMPAEELPTPEPPKLKYTPPAASLNSQISPKPIDMVKPAHTPPAQAIEAEQPINPLPTPQPNQYSASPIVKQPAEQPTSKQPTPRPPAPEQFLNEQPMIKQPSAEQPAAKQPAEPLGIITNLDGTPSTNSNPYVDPLHQGQNPLGRPMQHAITQEEIQVKKKHHKKIWLIIGAIVLICIAIGCGIAATILLIQANKEDVVATAIDKIISGDSPENINIDGTINVDYHDATAPISNLKIRLNSQAVTKSMINSSEATINAKLHDGSSFSMEISEIYAANNNLFIRISGLVDASENIASQKPSSDEKAILGEKTILEAIYDTFESIDGEWVRIPLEDLSTIFPEDVVDTSSLSCMTDLINSFRNNNNNLTRLYAENSFIGSSTEELNISNKQNPLYKILIDNDKFVNFTNNAKNSNLMANWANCIGDAEVDANILIENLHIFSEIYTEVDSGYNFTRLYFVVELVDDNATATVDLNLSYPQNINVPGPTEYTDLSAVIEDLSTGIYATDEETD